MDTDALAAAAYSRVPGARLAGIVDMQTGFFLAVEAGNCSIDEADAIAVSAREIFDGELGAGLRRSFVVAPGSQRVEEVIVVGEKTVFLFTRLSKSADEALVLACGRETNLGIILSNARQIIRDA